MAPATSEHSAVELPRVSQSKLESAIEQAVNTVSGFVLAWLAWQFLIPVLIPGLEPSPGQSAAVIWIFTVISIVRGYFWRRFFENGVHQTIHRFVRRIHERE